MSELRTLIPGFEPSSPEDAVDRLTRALRAEKARAEARHSTYDMTRHAALKMALRKAKARVKRKP
jgi:hypothetical protein